jgi:selenide,water dikinase
MRSLRNRDVQVIAGTVRGFSEGRLALTDGSAPAFDGVIWATGVTAPRFLARSGLACGPDGAVLTDPGLRSLSHDFVFAAGDCASLHESPRPKAGVWAVRAGPVLAANLREAAAGREIFPWQPQSDALVILGTGDRRAVAWRGSLSISGRLAFWIKAWIDRRWMARYQRVRPS